MSRITRMALVATAVLTGLAIWQIVSRQNGNDFGTVAGAAIGGPFTLTDQTGRTVTEADFKGRLLLIYFGYTFCPDFCPTSLATMAAAYDMLPPSEQADVQMAFATVDPTRDTVAHLAEYVTLFHPKLIGLTGTPAETDAAARAWRVFYKLRTDIDPVDYPVDHTTFVYLMGRDGKLVTFFKHDATAADMAADIEKAL